MRLLVGAAMAVLLIGCGGEGGSATHVTELTVAHTWARPTPPGATNGVVYFEVTSPVDDELLMVSVPTDIASDAGMHETMGGGGASPMPNMPEMTTAGGEMTMEPLASLPLPADATVVFAPGGKHVMLTGLVTALVEGSHFVLTLTTKSGHTVHADVVVSSNPPTA